MHTRKLIAVVLLSGVIATSSFAGGMIGGYGGTPSMAGAGNILGNPLWWKRSLTFHAPMSDLNAPTALATGSTSITVSRTHDATHTASYLHPVTGVPTLAVSDVARVESAGVLIEGARTNIAAKSDNLAASPWAADNAPDNVVYEAAGGPGGILPGCTAITTNGIYKGVVQPTILTATVQYTASVWAKGAAGGELIMFTDDNGTGGTQAITTSWVRYVKTFTAAATSSKVIVAQVAAAVIRVTGYQVEAAATASSYIPTGATSMIRNTDVLSISNSNLSDTVGSMSATVDTYNDAGGHYILVGNQGVYRLSNTLRMYDGTNELTGPAWSDALPHKIAARWDSTIGKMNVAFDGTLGVESNFDNNMSWAATTYIGYSGTTFAIFGHIKDLRIWNRALTDVEMKVLTQ